MFRAWLLSAERWSGRWFSQLGATTTANDEAAEAHDGSRAGGGDDGQLPTLDAANISFNLLKTAAGGGITIGPILLGAAKPVHIVTPTATVRRIINMTALAVVDSQATRK